VFFIYINMPYKKTTIKRTFRKKVTKRSGSKKKDPVIRKSQLYRAIHRNVETKIAVSKYGLTPFNSGIGASALDCIMCLPTVNQGIDNAQRIGQSIKPIKLVIRGYVVYNTEDLLGSGKFDARMLGARLFCYQDKGNRAASNLVYNASLLEDGTGTKNFTGVALDFGAPKNTDEFTFYADKKFRVLKPYGTTNDATPSNTTSIMCMNNSMYHPFTITLTKKHLPATFKYNDFVDINFPINFNPRISLGYCDLLNVAPDTVTTQLSMQFYSTLYYEDA